MQRWKVRIPIFCLACGGPVAFESPIGRSQERIAKPAMTLSGGTSERSQEPPPPRARSCEFSFTWIRLPETGGHPPHRAGPATARGIISAGAFANSDQCLGWNRLLRSPLSARQRRPGHQFPAFALEIGIASRSTTGDRSMKALLSFSLALSAAGLGAVVVAPTMAGAQPAIGHRASAMAYVARAGAADLYEIQSSQLAR